MVNFLRICISRNFSLGIRITESDKRFKKFLVCTSMFGSVVCAFVCLENGEMGLWIHFILKVFYFIVFFFLRMYWKLKARNTAVAILIEFYSKKRLLINVNAFPLAYKKFIRVSTGDKFFPRLRSVVGTFMNELFENIRWTATNSKRNAWFFHSLKTFILIQNYCKLLIFFFRRRHKRVWLVWELYVIELAKILCSFLKLPCKE